MCVYSNIYPVAVIKEYTTHTVQAVNWDHPQYPTKKQKHNNPGNEKLLPDFCS